MSTEYFFDIPKIELHAHLNGSLTVESIRKLIRMSKLPADSLPPVLSTPTSMEGVFKLFPLVQAITTSYETVRQATIEVITEFFKENTVYLELRTTPKERPGFSKKEYVQAVVDEVRLLLSIDRKQTLEEARETVDMVKGDESGKIVGLDLSGDPSICAKKLVPLFKEAKAAGCKLALHLAEVNSCLEEVDDLLELADRIGHGTFLHGQQRWIDTVVKKRIPLEICLTSNVLTSTTSTIEDSHLRFWKDIQVPVAICTDDSGLMGTTLSREYQLAILHFNLNVKDILAETLQMSFLERNSEEFERIKRKIETFNV